ncbi:peptide chain release factor N(5)-glutamine methyltransferase [Myroides guanonis]|uniref:Release factor glutamine methyltransferase n=1 Tax=Myroides guanonis TaxID=1150112 RepID=A0A1I3RVA9_9FLAO|nr:peptide chain release factor N(5)-glutamine methyltransferase [Myroides guanonis]SFJ50305.1 release factor glutamine methyltransferase [Myroides guanonis]
MKIREFKSEFISRLENIYDSSEVDSFFSICLENIEGKTRFDLMLDRDLEIKKSELWEKVIEQLVKERPIQYIFKQAHFYGLIFNVDENVLVPRPETEELVEWVINSVSDKGEPIKILDIGTGSGCIAISLARHLPNAKIYAMDISEKALEIAMSNALLNKVDVTFIHQDVLALQSLSESFDIIVSNPPYVRNLEKVEIHNNVLNYEPHLALFVEDDNALVFYEKIVSLASSELKKGGMLFFEINQYLGDETVKLFHSDLFKEVVLKKDIMQNDRMIRAFKK